jgi:hypothetical protein
MEDSADNMEESRDKEKNIHKTLISQCVLILMKIKFIPLKKQMFGDPTFHFFSFEALSCFVLYYVSSISLFSFSFLFLRASMNASKSNTLDSLELWEPIKKKIWSNLGHCPKWPATHPSLVKLGRI